MTKTQQESHDDFNQSNNQVLEDEDNKGNENTEKGGKLKVS